MALKIKKATLIKISPKFPKAPTVLTNPKNPAVKSPGIDKLYYYISTKKIFLKVFFFLKILLHNAIPHELSEENKT